MRCPRCNAENQPTAKFCIECGTAFQTPCVRCGYQNPPTAKFCQECGASLKSLSPSQSEVKDAPASWSAPITAERPSLESHDIPEEERKNVTALFADLKDSTELVRD